MKMNMVSLRMVVMLTILAAAFALPSFVLEFGDGGKSRLPVNSRASVPGDGER